MSELKNCPRCGRLFAAQDRSVCRKCQESEDDEYMVVRKYVRDNPGASVFEVSEATKVEEEKILQFLRDGRLQSRGMTTIIECARCGRYISEGTYCASCVNDLNSQIKQVLPGKSAISPDKPAKETRSGDRMYTKDNK